MPGSVAQQARYGRLVLQKFNNEGSGNIIVGANTENAFHYAMTDNTTFATQKIIF
jgi:hypothetical protein